MPGVPRVVPSIVVPIGGIAQAEAAIAYKARRVGEVAVVETIGVAVGIAHIVADGIILRGFGVNVECVALQTIACCAIRLRGVATVVFIHVAQLPDVVIDISIAFVIDIACRRSCLYGRFGILLLGRERVHVIVLCVCAEADCRE